jgi:hypothetical protein
MPQSYLGLLYLNVYIHTFNLLCQIFAVLQRENLDTPYYSHLPLER